MSMRKPKSNCGSLLKYWANMHGVRVRAASGLRTSDKLAPYSELCMHTRCAGKRIRAFAVNKRTNMAAIAYMDKGRCEFTSGLVSEVLPHGMKQERGLAGAHRRRR